MRRERVESSSIRSIGYDADGAVLEVEFRHGGVYRYFAVPRSTHAELLAAPSKGAFLADRIKPRHGVERVDAD